MSCGEGLVLLTSYSFKHSEGYTHAKRTVHEPSCCGRLLKGHLLILYCIFSLSVRQSGMMSLSMILLLNMNAKLLEVTTYMYL